MAVAVTGATQTATVAKYLLQAAWDPPMVITITFLVLGVAFVAGMTCGCSGPALIRALRRMVQHARETAWRAEEATPHPGPRVMEATPPREDEEPPARAIMIERCVQTELEVELRDPVFVVVRCGERVHHRCFLTGSCNASQGRPVTFCEHCLHGVSLVKRLR